MKKSLIYCFFQLSANFIIAQDSLNMTKLSGWTSVNATAYNDIWGYSDNGREYAIMGSNWGTHFIDVTEPSNPIEINSFQGSDNNVVWRDFKTKGHYAFGVSDDGTTDGMNNSLQIFDLQYLPDSVVKVYDNDSLTKSAHNIFIENDRAYLVSNIIHGVTKALTIIDISNPENPHELNSYDESMFGNCWGCLHDIYVKNDTGYCSAGYSGMFIYDFENVENPVLLNTIDLYTDKGYNHSSWLSEDGKYLVMADEVPHGLQMNLFDVSDMQNIEELDVFQANTGSTAHNPFIKGYEVYVSHYLDGVQVFNFENPNNVTRSAYYDTYPDNDSTFGYFDGCWGVYPYLKSRTILANDISYGLFVLKKITDVYLAEDTLLESYCQKSEVNFNFKIEGDFAPSNTFYLEISDLNGDFANSTIIGSVQSDTAGVISARISTSIEPGVHRIRVKSSNPAIKESTYKEIYVISAPEEPILDASVTDSLKITTAEDSILWYWNNGFDTLIQVNIPTIYIGNFSSGFFWASVYDSLGCTSKSAEKYLGLNEETKLFKIYPNPTQNEVRIESQTNDAFSITLSNSIGQVLLHKDQNYISSQIDLKGFEKGVYFVKVNNQTFKLIKQ